MCVTVLVTQSFPTLCDPMDCNPPGSSVHEICIKRLINSWGQREFISHSLIQKIHMLLVLMRRVPSRNYCVYIRWYVYIWYEFTSLTFNKYIQNLQWFSVHQAILDSFIQWCYALLLLSLSLLSSFLLNYFSLLIPVSCFRAYLKVLSVRSGRSL